MKSVVKGFSPPLNRNEVSQGPSPQALAAIRSFSAAHVNHYLEGQEASLLIPELSRRYKVPQDQIITTYGEEDFFRLAFSGLGRRDSILTSQWHYAYLDEYSRFLGIRLRVFGMKEQRGGFTFNMEDCTRQIRKTRPKIVLIASPNNPTGNVLSVGDLRKVLSVASRATLVVVDQAYLGFDPKYNDAEFLNLVKKHCNLVLLRSFSKWYALAGLRIGFAICGGEARRILKYRDRHLGMSRILEEVAIAALRSGAYYKKVSREIVRDRTALVQALRTSASFQAFDSRSNFVLVKIKDREALAAMKEELKSQGPLIFKFFGVRMIRITIGDAKSIEQLIRRMRRLP